MCSVASEEPKPESPAGHTTSGAGEEDHTTTMLNLITCGASELAGHILRHRFKGSESEAAGFFQAAMDSISSAKNTPQKSQQQPASRSEAQLSSADIPLDFGLPLTESVEISVVVPRAGKFQVALHSRGLLGTKTNAPATKLLIPYGSVTHMIFFPKPEDCRKVTTSTKGKAHLPPANLVLLCIDPTSSVLVNNKAVSQICMQLPWEKTKGALPPTEVSAETENTADKINDDDDSTSGSEDATNTWKRLFVQSLSKDAVVARVEIPGSRVSSSHQFTSHSDPRNSSTTSGMPFVKCYHGVCDGALYPLREGLLFFKPPKFIPRSTMHSISCGRGSSSSSSRYVDMMLTVHQSQKLDSNLGDDDAGGEDKHPMTEFTNIQREELGVLNDYIQKVLIPAMQEDAEADSGNASSDNDCTEDAKATLASSDATQNETESDDELKGNDDTDDEHGSEKEDADFETDDESDEDEDAIDDDDDDDDEFQVVADDFADELVASRKKRNSHNSATESEGEDGPVSKRRRRRTT